METRDRPKPDALGQVAPKRRGRVDVRAFERNAAEQHFDLGSIARALSIAAQVSGHAIDRHGAA